MKIKYLDQLEEESVKHNDKIKKKVLIRKGDIPKVTQLAQVVFKPGQIASAHEHKDMYEVFFFRSGNGLMVIGSIEYEISPGTCVTVEPGESHEVRNNSDEELVVIILGVEV